MIEIWKKVPGYGDFYEASSLGRIRMKDRPIKKLHSNGKMIDQVYKARIKKQCDVDGYKRVGVNYDGIIRVEKVHTMVLKAFAGLAPKGKPFVLHNDGNPSNNTPQNLRWGDYKDNALDMIKHGRSTQGSKHPMVKLTEDQVREIRSSSKSLKELKDQFNISIPQIYRIKKRELWRHLP